MTSLSEMRLLAVHAHPDDESSKGAATMAHYVRQGVEVMVATCTGGERGSILNAEMEGHPHAERDLTGLRRHEMAQAAAALDVDHRWLGFMDSGLPEGDPLPPLPWGCFALQPLERAAAPLVRLVRRFRPHVILTYDENGGYPHPDHIMCHKISMAAFATAADPAAHPELGEAWQVQKLYYQLSFNRPRIEALDKAMVERGLEPPYAERLAGWKVDPDHEARLTTQVPCADYFATRDRALLAHATQVDPEGSWFSVPLEVHRQAWPTEDWQLVESRVPTDLPEDDLFAGIAVPVGSLSASTLQG